MKLSKLLIAGGNSTLLVKGYKSSEKKDIIKQYLGQVEQIGFISYPRGIPKLEMMGNELSINGTIALASTLPKKTGLLLTSGYQGLVQYSNQNQFTTIKLNINYQKIENIVLLDGIGFIFLTNNQGVNKEYLSAFCSKYKLPAFGAIFYRKNSLVPYVYVRETKSLFKETACGSGSICLNILTGKTSIRQTTGKIIKIRKMGNKFLILTKVENFFERRWENERTGTKMAGTWGKDTMSFDVQTM